MEHEQKSKRRVGRPANPNRDNRQKSRRFFMLGKNTETIGLMNTAHQIHVRKHGKDTTDAAILREALREYASR